jgi:hypothetical protein
VGSRADDYAKEGVVVGGVVLAAAILTAGIQAGRLQASAQAAASDHVAVKDFAGTWNWMFEDRRFATMTLSEDGDQFTGSMTNFHIDLDARGGITGAATVRGATPIVKHPSRTAS